MKRLFMAVFLILVIPMSHAHTALVVKGNGTVTKVDGTVVLFANLLKTGEINNFHDGDSITVNGSDGMLLLKMDDNTWCKITHDHDVIIQGNICTSVDSSSRIQVATKEGSKEKKTAIRSGVANDLTTNTFLDSGLSKVDARLNVSFLGLLQSAQRIGLISSVDTEDPNTLIRATEQLTTYIISEAAAEQAIKIAEIKWIDKDENVFLLFVAFIVFAFIMVVLIKTLLYKPTKINQYSTIEKQTSNKRKYLGMRRALDRLMSEDPELAELIIKKIQERSKPVSTKA